jgi:hypothetical protein
MLTVIAAAYAYEVQLVADVAEAQAALMVLAFHVIVEFKGKNAAGTILTVVAEVQRHFEPLTFANEVTLAQPNHEYPYFPFAWSVFESKFNVIWRASADICAISSCGTGGAEVALVMITLACAPV